MLNNTAIDHFRRPGRSSTALQPEDADRLHTSSLQAEQADVVEEPDVVEQLLPEEPWNLVFALVEATARTRFPPFTRMTEKHITEP